MTTLLRDLYHPLFFEQLCPVLADVVPNFNERRFIYHVFDTRWPELNFNQRVRHIAEALHTYMPENFELAARLIVAIAMKLTERGEGPQQLQYLFLQDYLAYYGRYNVDAALKSIGEVTPFVSGEFALRPFLKDIPDKTLPWLRNWAGSKDESLTDLASEGFRRLATRHPYTCRPPVCQSNEGRSLRPGLEVRNEIV